MSLVTACIRSANVCGKMGKPKAVKPAAMVADTPTTQSDNNLLQHGQKPTRKKGSIIDLVISKGTLLSFEDPIAVD
ncbi:hypothetical protein NDU88_006768, partial [Pleurodeles waltl]